jgi:DNA (cytosine-5)-methyltransferase 1
MSETAFRFIDLCAGIGGLRIPFEQRQVQGENWGVLPGKCVWASEIDKDAIDVYSKNFCNNVAQLDEFIASINRDFTTFDAKKVPDHELLLAGFPCQPFSYAGKRMGRLDERGKVFDSIEHIIAEKRPNVVLLENVKGLRSLKNPGPNGTLVLAEIMQALARPRRKDGSRPRGLSYFVATPKVLNARDFGLPQNRERLFIVAVRADIALKNGLQAPSDFDWPIPTNSDRGALRLGDFLDQEVPPEYTISQRLWESHKSRKARNEAAGKGFGYRAFAPSATYVSTISSRYFKDGSEALIMQESAAPRKLTPREGARLQGFPESFELHVSKMKAFKQIGNAVPVPVVAAIAKVLWDLQVLKPDLG